MVKGLIKFVFLLTLISHNVHASDKDFLTNLPNLIFSKVIEFTDIESVKRLHFTSKSLHNKILGLENHFKNKHVILDPKQIKLLKTCMSEYLNKNKKITGSMSPFCFSEYLIKEINTNKNLENFMKEFMDTLFHEKKSVLIDWQSRMIRKKILMPFFKELIKKTENQTWEQVFENELFTTEKYTETHHIYHILPFVFFLDQGIPVNYITSNTMYSYEANTLEVVAEKGFYNLCLFLLKNGAEVNKNAKELNYISDGSCLYSAILGYIEFLRQEKNCDESRKTIRLLIDWGADKDCNLSWGQTIRQFVNQHIKDPEILKYFKEEK